MRFESPKDLLWKDPSFGNEYWPSYDPKRKRGVYLIYKGGVDFIRPTIGEPTEARNVASMLHGAAMVAEVPDFGILIGPVQF